MCPISGTLDSVTDINSISNTQYHGIIFQTPQEKKNIKDMSGNFCPHWFCHFGNLIQRIETCPIKKQVTKKTTEVQRFSNYTPCETNFDLGIPLQKPYNILQSLFWHISPWYLLGEMCLNTFSSGTLRFHRSGVSKTYGRHADNWKANFKTGATNTPSKHSRFIMWTGTEKINLTQFQTQPQCNTRNEQHF